MYTVHKETLDACVCTRPFYSHIRSVLTSPRPVNGAFRLFNDWGEPLPYPASLGGGTVGHPTIFSDQKHVTLCEELKVDGISGAI